VLAVLSSNCALDPAKGAQGWNIGIASEGCEILAATDDGTVSATLERGGLREVSGLFGIGFADPARSDGRNGIIGLTVLSNPAVVKVDPAGSPHAILRLTVRARIPDEGCTPCTLRFEDGLAFPTGPSTSNAVTAELAAHKPKLGALSFTLCAGGRQRPGDSNQDGKLDLSDAIWLLGHLFLGTQPKLPCGGGSASAPGPGDLELADVNGDGGIDLSDAVSILGFLFLGARPPALGTECVAISGCPDICSQQEP
jgi:hypothetical protein